MRATQTGINYHSLSPTRALSHAVTVAAAVPVPVPVRVPAAAVLSGIRGKIEMFHFSPATLERAGLPNSAATNIPPFVVIASNDINQVGQSREVVKKRVRMTPQTVTVKYGNTNCSHNHGSVAAACARLVNAPPISS